MNEKNVGFEIEIYTSAGHTIRPYSKGLSVFVSHFFPEHLAYLQERRIRREYADVRCRPSCVVSRISTTRGAAHANTRIRSCVSNGSWPNLGKLDSVAGRSS